MNEIIFADETVLTDTHVLVMGPTDLFVYIQKQGMTLAAAFEILNRPERTAKITAVLIDGSEKTYEGYTDLIGLRKEDDGQVTAILRRDGNV